MRRRALLLGRYCWLAAAGLSLGCMPEAPKDVPHLAVVAVRADPPTGQPGQSVALGLIHSEELFDEHDAGPPPPVEVTEQPVVTAEPTEFVPDKEEPTPAVGAAPSAFGYTITEFNLRYLEEVPALPPLSSILELRIKLGTTAEGYVAPTPDVPVAAFLRTLPHWMCLFGRGAAMTGGAGATFVAWGTNCGAPPVVAAFPSAAAISSAEANRSSGSLARALNTTRSTASGIAGFRLRGGGSGSRMCCITMPIGVSATNGTRPVSISNSITPREYTSLRASVGSRPYCSGGE